MGTPIAPGSATGAAEMASASQASSSTGDAGAPQGGPAMPTRLRASFRGQAVALFRNQMRLQRRDVRQNIRLISMPILFCLIMLIIQVVVNRLLLNNRNLKCGHKCNECCTNAALTEGCYAATPAKPCDLTQTYCKQFDPSVTGVEYSTGIQASFCAVPDPARWPPLYFIPWLNYRDPAYGPKVPMLHTGANLTQASAYTDAMLPPFPGTGGPPSGAALSSTMLRGGLQDSLSTAFTAYTFARGAAGAMADNIDVAGLLSTPVRFPGAPTIEVDLAWAGLGSMAPLTILTKNCTDVLAWGALNGGIPALNMTILGTKIDTSRLDLVWFSFEGLKFLTCAEADLQPRATAHDIQGELFCAFKGATGCGSPRLFSYRYPAAVDWRDSGPGKLRVRFWLDNVRNSTSGSGLERFQRWTKPINMAVNAWLADYLGAQYSVTQTYESEMPKRESRLLLDFSSLLGPSFFVWVIGLPLPVMVQALVYEKEQRLRVMMKMHGLSSNTYWIVMYLWWALVWFVYCLAMMAFGSAIGLNFFRKTSYSLQILFYLTAVHAMVGQGFLMSSLFQSSRTGLSAAYLWVLLCGVVAGNIMQTFIDGRRSFVPVLELIPSFGVYRVLYEMSAFAFRGQYRGQSGLGWGDMHDPNMGVPRVLGVFVAEFVVLTALAWYLEQVLDSSVGVRRHWLFFLGHLGRSRGYKRDRTPAPLSENVYKSEEVAREERAVDDIAPAARGTHPVIAEGLQKVFPAVGGHPEKVAVRHLSLAVRRGEVVGLVGPNGAGKTTALNMLVGFLEPTAGTAYIEGLDIMQDLDTIYTLVGVCPQHDTVWARLTGREHLEFYGRLKNLPPSRLISDVDDALRAVNLSAAADRLVGTYSGGMRRRLSVAMSIIGSPRVVFMDEPSTGLDPASRRNLWDVVKQAKKDKAVIITTHSMQEAEVLCDRLGIFIDGELFTLSHPREISARYGGYVILTVVTEGREDAEGREEVQRAADALVASISPHATLVQEVACTRRYRIPAEGVSLAAVFAAMEAAVACGSGVVDWAMRHASLEDVFIDIAKLARAKSHDMP